jgi:hypothetical protein
MQATLRDFAGIGYAVLCTVMQGVTGARSVINSRNNYLLVEYRICHEPVWGSSPFASFRTTYTCA